MTGRAFPGDMPEGVRSGVAETLGVVGSSNPEGIHHQDNGALHCDTASTRSIRMG